MVERTIEPVSRGLPQLDYLATDVAVLQSQDRETIRWAVREIRALRGSLEDVDRLLEKRLFGKSSPIRLRIATALRRQNG